MQTAQFCHFKYACTQPHAHPVRLREKEGLLCPSLSWCSLTRSKQRFFCSFPATLSIEVGVSGFLPASCFESSVESYCDRATWSVSAGVSARASIGEQQMDTHGGKLVASLKCLTTEKKYLSIDIDPCVPHWPLASIDLCPEFRHFFNMIYCKSRSLKASYRSWFIQHGDTVKSECIFRVHLG